MKIIQERRTVLLEDYYIDFDYGDGSGFRFPATLSGNLCEWDMTEEAKRNYEWCMFHKELFEVWNEFHTNRRHYTEPAIGECICGQQVVLEDQYMGACECPKCHRWYNIYGQSLVNPMYWED